MNALQSVMLPTPTFLELANFLRTSGAGFNVDEAARRAVCAWLADARPASPAQAVGPLRGYQWKSLFLPERTELRMTFGGRTYYAAVVGDHIVYQGRQVSPRQMTLAVAGDGHNAWRELWLRFPDEKKWRLAIALKRELTRLAETPPRSPFEAITSAAADMRNALASTLQLLDKTASAHVSKLERRCDHRRRASDIASDDDTVPFDD
jgi:hypothetical protein